MKNKANIFITDSDYSCNDKSFEYLLGFQPSRGAMLLSDKSLFVILDSRYFEKTTKINEENIKNITGNDNIKIIYINSGDFIEQIIEIIKNNNFSKIVFEGKIAGEYIEKISKNIQIDTKILQGGFFAKKRMKKSKIEKEKIKKAIEIIDKVYLYIYELNKKGELIGKTELEVRGIIISKIFEYGGEGESFDSIVAFGENSAIPHHKSGKTKIGNGVLLIDMGAKFEGYCSDFTRTFWVGEKNKQYNKFVEIYEIVKNAHINAFEKTKKGMIGAEIDNLTRSYIENAGYGDKYTHGTGHGIGLDIHEESFINKKSDTKIKNKMFFTIEPGIYLEGEFGIRLEDIVFMKNGKLEKYSNVGL